GRARLGDRRPQPRRREARPRLRGSEVEMRDERGYTLIEMLTVLVIFGTVMSALMVLFVQGTGAEVDMNNRFQAQQDARLALDKIRREVECASAVPVSSPSAVEVSMPSY